MARARQKSRHTRQSFCRSLFARSLRCEQLEDRRLLAVITVDTDQDVVDFTDDVTSLREAIFAANIVPGADEIEFDFGHDDPATILLEQGELEITDSLTITGSGAELLTIDASPSEGSIFTINDSIPQSQIAVTIFGIALTGADNSAIRSVEDLNINSVNFSGNEGLRGGGISVDYSFPQVHDAKLTVRNSQFTDNHATSTRDFVSGGGIMYAGNFGEVTIENSNFVGNSSASGGGAIGIGGFSNLVNITDTSVEGNQSVRGGGILIADDNAYLATFQRVQVRDNIATQAGGGLYFSGKEVAIIDCQVTGNQTIATPAAHAGGAIFKVGGGSFSIRSSLIRDNHTIGNGGGITLQGSPLELIDSVVSNNYASARGGGIYGTNAFIDIRRSTISRNKALAGDGGGLSVNQGPLRITDSAVSDNLSGASGGGISVFNVQTQIVQSTVSGNSAAGSGGGMGGRATFVIVHSTVTNNTADSNADGVGEGGGIRATGQSPSLLNQSIVAGNHDLSGTANDALGNFNTTLSLIGGGAEFLAPLADNGGPTKTHALLPGSPAINAGDPALIAGVGDTPEFDQRDEPFTRVFAGRIDIGAFERQSFVVDTLADEMDSNYGHGDLSLREAISLANSRPGQDTIEFDPTLAGGTILLEHGELAITDSLTITGPGAELLTIDAQQRSRIFNITTTSGDFTFSGMTLTGGRTTGDNTGLDFRDSTFSGGAVRSLTSGELSFDQIRIIGNATSGYGARGGGIFAYSSTTITHSIVSNNSTTGHGARGGGIWSNRDVILTQSTVSQNSTRGDRARGGGLLAAGGLILTQSNVSGNSTAGTDASGGGIWNDGIVLITGSNITGNSTTGYAASGGGIFARGARASFRDGVTISNSTVNSNNTAGALARGGGIYAKNVTLSDSTISGNKTTGSGASGGGIFSGRPGPYEHGDVTLSQCTVSGNSTAGYHARGGGIFASNVTLTQSTISGNRTAGNLATGGGIYTREEIILSQSIVNGNSTAGIRAGGGGIVSNGHVTLSESTVSDNRTAGIISYGGGIFSRDMVTLTQSTISGNATLGDSSSGGGVLAYGNVMITQSTLSDNSTAGSDAGGGGLYGRADILISGSIVAGNITDNGNSDLRGTFGTLSMNYSLIGTNAGTSFAEAPVGSPDANGNLIGGPIHGVIDPMLSPLADNGGPTLTHALLLGSPAINSGEPTLVGGVDGTPEFDQRGEPFTRVFAGRIDIGAFERQSFVVDTLIDEMDGNYGHGDLSLREAIGLANSRPGQDTIEFDPSLAGGTILLEHGELEISDALEVNGLGAELLTIDASGNDPTPDENNGDGSRVFRIDESTSSLLDVSISGLTLFGADSSQLGGAILSFENLMLQNMTVSGNSATVGGGLNSQAGTITIEDSTFVGNESGSGRASAIFSQGPLTLNGVSVTANHSSQGPTDSSAITTMGSISATGSTISDNSVAGSVVRGAAIISGGMITMFECTVDDNRNLGGIRAPSANIGDSSISENDGTGLLATQPANASSSIDSSLIHGNRRGGVAFTAAGRGNGGVASITRSTISGNSGTGTGGVYFRGFSILIQDCLITGNTADVSSAPNSGGGGIRIYGFNPTVSILRTTVTNNHVVSETNNGNGGGILIAQANATIIDCIISRNSVDGLGGGLRLIGGVVNVTRTGFSENSATLVGGGIYSSANLTITDSEVSGNTSSAGGGITSIARLNLVRSTIRANEAHGNLPVSPFVAGQGGGILARNSDPTSAATIVDTSIEDNIAADIGGGVYSGRNLSISNSMVAGNQASAGGGIWLRDGTINQVTISGNTAVIGGGIYASNSIVNHSTVAFNTATSLGGGIFIEGTQLTLDHTIVAGNFSAHEDISGSLGTTISARYSFIGSNVGNGLTPAPIGSPDANGNLIGDTRRITPRLDPLADNGGPTLTHALLPGSPAINAGDPAAVAGMNGVPEQDQRGGPFARIVGGRIDIGAFELQPAAGTFNGDFDADGDVDGRDFLRWQRGYGATGSHVTKALGDATGNGTVDGKDLDVWQGTYGNELSAFSGQLSESQEQSAKSREPDSSMAPRAVTEWTRARDRVPRYDGQSVAPTLFEAKHVDELDRAFDDWLPVERTRFDFGDIVTRREFKRPEPIALGEMFSVL